MRSFSGSFVLELQGRWIITLYGKLILFWLTRVLSTGNDHYLHMLALEGSVVLPVLRLVLLHSRPEMS